MPENESTSRVAFAAGMRQALPILPGVAPFGVIAGVAAVDSGLSPWTAMALSGFIFAGASQLAAIQLLAAGAAVPVILLTIAVINLRFAMYSASLAPHLRHLGRRDKLLAGYLLVDQAYALSILRFGGMQQGDKFRFYLGIATPLWLTWQSSTAIGAFLGANVPDAWSLEFTVPLTFLSMLIVSVTDGAMLVAAAVAGLVAVAGHALPYNLGLLAGATCGIAAGTVAWRLHSKG